MPTFRKILTGIVLASSTTICCMSIPSVADALHTEMNLDDSAVLAYCKNVRDFYWELDEYSDEELGAASPSDLAYIGAGMNLAFEESAKEAGLYIFMKVGSEMNEELLLDYGSKAMTDHHPETLHILGLASMKSQMEAVGFSDRAENLVSMYFMDTLDGQTLADLKEQGFNTMTNYGHSAIKLLKHFNKTATSRKHSALGSGLLVMIGIEIAALFRQCRDAD